MIRVHSLLMRRISRCVALVLAACFGVAATYPQALADQPAGTLGRIDFDQVDLPPAKLEIDLNEGMFSDTFGLGEAAIAGVAEQLQQAAGKSPSAESTRLAAEQLAAAQEMIKLARGIVQEARVRIYEDGSEEDGQVSKLMEQFEGQLKSGGWENIVRVRDEEDILQVSLLRDEKAIRGAFIIFSEGDDVTLANVVGNVSPENVKKLASAATKIGLENGLQQELDQWMRKVDRRIPPASAPSAEPSNPQE